MPFLETCLWCMQTYTNNFALLAVPGRDSNNTWKHILRTCACPKLPPGSMCSSMEDVHGTVSQNANSVQRAHHAKTTFTWGQLQTVWRINMPYCVFRWSYLHHVRRLKHVISDYLFGCCSWLVDLQWNSILVAFLKRNVDIFVTCYCMG